MSNARQFIVGLLIATTCLNTIATGDGTKLLFFGKGTPKGTKVVPPATYVDSKQVGFRPDGGQYLIPSFANGGFPPAQTVCGIGQRGVIQGTLTSGDQPIVACEQPSYTPTLSNLAIIGPDTQDDNYSSGGLVWNTPTEAHKGAGDIIGASNTAPIVITCPTYTKPGGWVVGHTLTDGAEVAIVGVQGNTAANSKAGTVTASDNDSPTKVTSASHGLSTGDRVMIRNAHGDWAMNGVWTITVNDADHFTLNDSAAFGGYSNWIPATWYKLWTISDVNYGAGTFKLVGSNGTASSTYTANTGGWFSNLHDNWQGAHIAGVKSLVDDVFLSYIAGTALTMQGGAEDPGISSFGAPWFSGAKMCARHLTLNRCYRGLDFRRTDGCIMGPIDMFGLRDYGIKVSGAAVQITGPIHGYGIWSGSRERCRGPISGWLQVPIAVLAMGRSTWRPVRSDC